MEETENQVSLTYNDGKFELSGITRSELFRQLGIHANKFKDTKENFSTLDFKAAALYKQYADKRAQKILSRAFVRFYSPPKRPLPPFLDPHQVEGIDWVLTRSRSYLAHAPGAGKTCMAITAAIFTECRGQVVFIVPPSLTGNWARETTKFHQLVDRYSPQSQNLYAPPTITVVTDTARQKEVGWSSEFLIIPDSMVTKTWVLDKLLSLKIRFLAVDEASRFKDAHAQRSRALFGGVLNTKKTSSGLIYSPCHTVLLDGSPMPNRPMELWAPTYAMSPDSIDFMDEIAFGFKYCGAKVNSFGRWEFKHSSNEAELKEKLTKTFMHVVSEDKLNHPERLRSILFMDQDIRSLQHKEWEKKHLSTFNFSDLDENLSLGEIATYRKELGLNKVPWIADYVADRLKIKNESILLFAWHREVVFALEWALRNFNPGVIVGNVPENIRDEEIDSFQKGYKKLLILNIAAGGRGYNLQRADRVIFGEFSWSNETNIQAEKRASRKGNEKAFTRCEYICSPNSMDEVILNAVFRKAERVRKVIG